LTRGDWGEEEVTGLYLNLGLAAVRVDHLCNGKRARRTLDGGNSFQGDNRRRSNGLTERTLTIHCFVGYLGIDSASICIEAAKCH
jgi:hypothetical protein